MSKNVKKHHKRSCSSTQADFSSVLEKITEQCEPSKENYLKKEEKIDMNETLNLLKKLNEKTDDSKEIIIDSLNKSHNLPKFLNMFIINETGEMSNKVSPCEQRQIQMFKMKKKFYSHLRKISEGKLNCDFYVSKEKDPMFFINEIKMKKSIENLSTEGDSIEKK